LARNSADGAAQLDHCGRAQTCRTARYQLKVTLLPQEKKLIEQVKTGNIEAYTYYLRGRDFLHRRSKHYFRLARRMFAKAV
jgi:hypothetical protein